MPQSVSMWLSGQWFGSEVIERIAATAKAEPLISRRALSKRICEWLNWYSANGRPQEVSCRKALRQLHRRGCIELPEGKGVSAFSQRGGVAPEAPAVAQIRCHLADLGEVEVIPVSSRYSKASSIWNGLMARYHYLGSGPLCGAQIRYLIRCSAYGWLGALSYSAAAWRMKRRDEWIGWSERARRAHLQKVICNSRFLLVPSVEVANLASHVLSLSVGRLGADWHARYGYAPVLVETFVEGQRFAGTCYRAANWTHVGQTAGRSDGLGNGKVSTGKKEIYTYPLTRDWQGILCEEPADALVLRSAGDGERDWVEGEFAGARLTDDR